MFVLYSYKSVCYVNIIWCSKHNTNGFIADCYKSRMVIDNWNSSSVY